MTRDEMKEMDLTALARLFKEYKDLLAGLKAESSEIQKNFDMLRKEVFPEKMDELGYDNVNITGVGRISLRAEMYTSIPASTKAEAYKWLEDNGFEDLITETVNGSTFKAFCKEQMLSGVELPDNLFSITPYTMATLTKS